MPSKRAAEIADISQQRLRYWEKTDLVTPDVERAISLNKIARLYARQRVVELVVASELRRQAILIQQIRRIIDHLRQQGYKSPLREVRFALSGGRVMFQHADGSQEDSTPFKACCPR